MPYRDEHGHFISEEEAREKGLIDEPEEEVEEEEDEYMDDDDTYEPEPRTPIHDQATRPTGSVFVDVGRGEPMEVQVGAPFVETLNRLAEMAHYGGDYRVFLNGSEVLYIEEAPATIEAGMRIAITSYDKPG